MHWILNDTCVWLDLSTDRQSDVVLTKLEGLVREGKLTLVVPPIVTEEFARNKPAKLDSVAKQLDLQLKIARKSIKEWGDPSLVPGILGEIDKIRQGIPTIQQQISNSMVRVERLLNHKSCERPEQTVPIVLAAVNRALEKKAPFHKDKNSVADAILIETFEAFVESRQSDGETFAFVTENKSDFGDVDDSKPHPDLAAVFSTPQVAYFNNIGRALNAVEPDAVPAEVVDHLAAIRNIPPPTCHFCKGHNLQPIDMIGRGAYGETLYFLHCMNCGQQTEVREAWNPLP